jgi:hypothetical protein
MRDISIMVRKSGVALVVFTILMVAAVAIADDHSKFRVVPFVFDPFHTDLVAADWVEGSGCPTNATTNDGTTSSMLTDAACPVGDTKDKENAGLLLVKTGPTNNFASAGARIKGVKGITLTELGFDIRIGTHCGAGAPRFNVVTSDNVLHFAGCSASTLEPSTSTAWQRRRISPTNAAQWSPTPPGTMAVNSISIVFDEGQDNDPVGLAIIDNIDINGTLVGTGEREKEGSEKHEK